MKELTIHKERFIDMAFGRDLSKPKSFRFDRAYLDCETGEVIWFFEGDEDARKYLYGPDKLKKNSMRRWMVKNSLGSHLEIPGRTHREHQEILQEFLSSDWTHAEALKTRVKEAYNGSIDSWKRLNDDGYVLDQYRRYKMEKLTEMSEVFLREHGIKPIWIKPDRM